jgi:putative transcriptional regulator
VNQQQTHDEMLELAAQYALGTLPEEQVVPLKAHLEAGCPDCQEALEAFEAVVDHLGYAVPAAHPPPSVRDRLLARIHTAAAADHRAWTLVRDRSDGWEAAGIEGMWRKLLYRDQTAERRTTLVRMQPAACYPAHRHADTEELYVLDGDLAVEGHVLHAGDFCAAFEGTTHRSVSSMSGCLLLVVASECDEVVEDEGTDAAQKGLVFAHATDGAWEDGPAAGVTLKRLLIDPTHRTMTALVRMQAGSSLLRHRHVTAEQVYMLEGDGHVADHVLGPGDFLQTQAGTIHDVTYTEGGCLFLLVSSRVELLS